MVITKFSFVTVFYTFLVHQKKKYNSIVISAIKKKKKNSKNLANIHEQYNNQKFIAKSNFSKSVTAASKTFNSDSFFASLLCISVCLCISVEYFQSTCKSKRKINKRKKKSNLLLKIPHACILIWLSNKKINMHTVNTWPVFESTHGLPFDTKN